MCVSSLYLLKTYLHSEQGQVGFLDHKKLTVVMSASREHKSRHWLDCQLGLTSMLWLSLSNELKGVSRWQLKPGWKSSSSRSTSFTSIRRHKKFSLHCRRCARRPRRPRLKCSFSSRSRCGPRPLRRRVDSRRWDGASREGGASTLLTSLPLSPDHSRWPGRQLKEFRLRYTYYE